MKIKENKMVNSFDYLVIGSGSGGISSAIQASKYNVKVGIIEGSKNLGGTCVNHGCVPKKIMYFGSMLSSMLHESINYGFSFQKKNINFSWEKLIKNRNTYIKNIHNFYKKKITDNNIKLIQGYAKFKNNKHIIVNDMIYTGKYILLSPGSSPKIPNIYGAEYGITSDDFFKLHKKPKRVVIVGSGYIALEIACMLHALGSQITLIIRYKNFLRKFDDILGGTLMEILKKKISVIPQNKIIQVKKNNTENLTIYLQNKISISNIDCLIWAIGRSPNIAHLNLKNTDICLKNSAIQINKYEQTTVKNIYALGDVTNTYNLTPVALKRGRYLSQRLFNQENIYINYKYVPTIIFTHPPLASVGYSEKFAISKYGKENIKIYTTSFKSMYDTLAMNNIKTAMKLICLGDKEEVIGCHIIGLNCDEMLQGITIAMNIGATKKDFDHTIAIHPTISEELVTMKLRENC